MTGQEELDEDTQVNARDSLEYDELTSKWFHGYATFSMKTLNLLEYVIAAAVSPSKSIFSSEGLHIKEDRYHDMNHQLRIAEFQDKLENPEKRWEFKRDPRKPGEGVSLT